MQKGSLPTIVGSGLAGDNMKKLVAIPVLFLLACSFAGGYGALHNQISYSVAPEYFTQYKFIQFQIPEGSSPRMGAAIVGWNAAWWMGGVIGIVLIPVGRFLLPERGYVGRMVGVFGVVALTTLVVGLVALGASYVLLNADSVGELSVYNRQIVDDLAFSRAGTMHNFSYLGGLLGIVTGCLAIHRLAKRSKQSPIDAGSHG
ncbi:MAG: hypothetical protein ACK57G_15555 [Planctomycetota bacterium]